MYNVLLSFLQNNIKGSFSVTDKELRKLSRLELLELLLEASKENEKLKEKIEKLKVDNKTAQSIENLSVATRQVANALKYADSITSALKTSSIGSASSSKEGTVKNAQPDREIYKRMLCFFAKNDEKLSVFPADIENDVRERIKSLLEKRTTN